MSGRCPSPPNWATSLPEAFLLRPRRGNVWEIRWRRPTTIRPTVLRVCPYEEDKVLLINLRQAYVLLVPLAELPPTITTHMETP